MSVKTYLIIGAAIAIGYGIAFLLVPQVVLATYGSHSDPAILLGYRYFGVGLLTAGLVCWAIRDCREPATLQGVLMGLGIADVAGVAVSLAGTLSGTINGLGWLNVLLYAALAAGSLYLYLGTTHSARLAV